MWHLEQGIGLGAWVGIKGYASFRIFTKNVLVELQHVFAGGENICLVLAFV